MRIVFFGRRLFLSALQSGSTNTSVATSSSGNVATDSYGSYGTNAWPGNTGSGYNMGGYDMSSMYNSYTQMYEQYYGSQVELTCLCPNCISYS